MAKKKSKRPVQSQLPVAGNFWTFDLKRHFHSAVVDLKSKTDIPDGASQGYRHKTRENDSRYVLSEEEELELADHIAFLFPTEERSETITAVTVEEHDGGTKLVVMIASNETPKRHVVVDFEGLMKEVQRYAIEGRGRRTAFEALFQKVVDARSTRILQRLQTPNGGSPTFWRGRLIPLHDRLREKIRGLKNSETYNSSPKDVQERLCCLFRELEKLCVVYKSVDSACRPAKLKAALRTAVEKSYQLSTREEGRHTLTHQLTVLGLHLDQYDNKEILQVDKIGRYYSACTYMLRLARHHKHLFSSIDIRVCESNNKTFNPVGSTSDCHVHGEVKLAIHYEQHPHHPPPRTIGSSKSMCFLCGLFLDTHSSYRVSHSHKRLYDKWTIPDVNWMNEDQVARFQGIVRIMTQELRMLRTRAKGGSVRYPVESRCHLPFSYPPSSVSAASSTATIRPVASPARSLTPTQATYHENGETISHSKEALASIFEDVAALQLQDIGPPCQSPSLPPMPPEYRPDVATIHLSGQAQASNAEVLATQQPPALYAKKEHPSTQDALPTPPASPVRIPRPQPSRSPSLRLLPSPTSLPPPHSPASSRLTLFPTFIPPLTHTFSFRGPDVEITISHIPFIFEFASISTGTLAIMA